MCYWILGLFLLVLVWKFLRAIAKIVADDHEMWVANHHSTALGNQVLRAQIERDCRRG